MIYRIEETTSTNDDAKRPEYGHDDIIWAERQTAGRGQRGHTWISRAEESLTFSHILTRRRSCPSPNSSASSNWWRWP